MSRPRLIHFIGSHRTGSKSIANFLNGASGKVISVHQRPAQQWVNLISNFYAAGHISRPVYKIIIDRLLIKWLESQSSEYVIETNGFNLFALELIVERIPDTKIIHVVRDPRSFVRSLINYRHHNELKRFLQIYLPYWELKAYYLGIIDKSSWKKLSEPERIAWQWKIKNNLIIDKYSGNDNYLRVKFEDLYDESKGVLDSIIKFSGLEHIVHSTDEFYSNKVNYSQDSGFPGWQQWDLALTSSIDSICGSLMNSFGYGFEREWQDKLSSK